MVLAGLSEHYEASQGVQQGTTDLRALSKPFHLALHRAVITEREGEQKWAKEDVLANTDNCLKPEREAQTAAG